jgi:hypothetical protein
VGNGNACAETFCHAAKNCPLEPHEPFDTLDEARARVQRFVQWYNDEHRHGRIKYVTPVQRHRGEVPGLLRRRTEVYQAVRQRPLQRWAGETRNWSLAPTVWLNPERDADCRPKRKAA